MRGMAQVISSHGAPFARAHCSTSRWPRSAATAQVLSSHGHPFAAPTAAPPSGRLPRHRRKSPRPTASSFLRPPRDLQVPTPRDARERPRVPRTPSLFLRPRQPADRPDEVRHPPELSPHRRDVPHVADGRREDDVAHTPAHQREHREVATVEPREHVRVEDIARVRGESFQARARGEIWGSRSVPRDLVDVPAVHPRWKRRRVATISGCASTSRRGRRRGGGGRGGRGRARRRARGE